MQIYRYKFSSEEELQDIITKNNDKYIYAIARLCSGSYIEFSDVPTFEALIESKISILEAENETLKQELSITQDAVNELIFNSLNI